jgi:hypothetical protein
MLNWVFPAPNAIVPVPEIVPPSNELLGPSNSSVPVEIEMLPGTPLADDV